MTDLNSVALVGRLVADAQYKDIGQYHLGSFTVAVNASKKGSDGKYIDEASFYDVDSFNVYGIRDYLKKGIKVAVLGHLKQDRWEKDGQKYSKVKIMADSVQLLSKRDDNSSGNEDFQVNF